MSVRGHQVGMIACNALYRGKSQFPPKDLRFVAERYPPRSVVIEERSQRWFAGVLKRLSLDKLVSTEWLATIRGLSCARDYISDFGTPDIVHAIGEKTPARIALALKRRSGIPFVLNVHSIRCFSYTRPWGRTEQDLAEILRHCHRLLPLNEPLGRQWEAIFGPELTANWLAIPNPVDETIYNIPFDAKSGQPSGADIRLFEVSKRGADENLTTLLRAFVTALKDRDAELRLAGVARLSASAKAVLRELSERQQVTLLGELSREAVAEEIRNCSIFVQPSHSETTANLVPEALMSGRPVISTVLGPEPLVSKSSGLAVSHNDPNALAQAIRHIADRLETYDAETIRNEALATFGHDVVFGAMERVYRDILTA
jgi:glycosyltransferase involved in cell wall biosynthesis